MRIVVTGREGQVVSCLSEAASANPDITLIRLGRPDLDLAEPDTIGPAIKAAAPDFVVSAAAYTAVDQAEDEPELAFRINADAAGAVAAAAAELGVPVLHLSTDYVFSGDLDRPYAETDPTGPTGVYGASKLAGEKAVAAANARHLIFRTAWVYSVYGKNFLKTMLRLAETRDEISVVSDQWGNPTSAHDIAQAILQAAAVIQANPQFASWGVYHLAGSGETNWSGFAARIFEASAEIGTPAAAVVPISSSEFPSKAKRPANSRLNCRRLGDVFGWTAPDWKDSSRLVVERLSRA